MLDSSLTQLSKGIEHNFATAHLSHLTWDLSSKAESRRRIVLLQETFQQHAHYESMYLSLCVQASETLSEIAHR